MVSVYLLTKLSLQGRSTVGNYPSPLCVSLLGIRFIEWINIPTSLDHDRISAVLGYKTQLQLLEERRISTVSHVKNIRFSNSPEDRKIIVGCMSAS